MRHSERIEVSLLETPDGKAIHVWETIEVLNYAWDEMASGVIVSAIVYDKSNYSPHVRPRKNAIENGGIDLSITRRKRSNWVLFPGCACEKRQESKSE